MIQYCQKFTILLFVGGLFQQAQCLRRLNHFTRSILILPHLMVAYCCKKLKVVISKKHQLSVLELLHEGHLRMTHMKSLARLHVWWPSINFDIEQTVQTCTNCALMARYPARVQLHSWDFPRKPWQRLHMDFSGPFRGKNIWLIVIDPYSKWPETHAISTTSAQAMIFINFARYFLHTAFQSS